MDEAVPFQRWSRSRTGTDPTSISRLRSPRAPHAFLVPDASTEILTVALSAVREDERTDYVQRLQVFTEQHRERLEKMLAAYGPGSAPAEHGRYMLVGQPESLIIVVRVGAGPRAPQRHRQDLLPRRAPCPGGRGLGLGSAGALLPKWASSWALDSARPSWEAVVSAICRS
ncbi:hypothetical protein J7E93_06765 [Streptomyces sp. ISL-36]|uniref:hypothetical protein n=1 Tax=Streptomyces sp. ISL-36 TaxID=2819182 RepID=UPI001BE85157|nr:hypothetical protein [Streptomyces sp. ISL-36]MBT2439828.1 hypothetical protein [Streptomyces sp. ISL-36]